MAEGKEEHYNVLDDDDDKPAITTVADKLEEVMGLIEEQKEDEVYNILQNHNGLLHRACDIGWVDAVAKLLERKVPLTEWNESHLHPLHLAVRNNHMEIVKILLDHDPNIIDRPSKFGETPLHFACLKGHTPLVKLLLDCKADIRLDDRCGNTALHYAVSSNNPELVEYLLRDKDLVQLINKKNEFQHSPIHRAAVLQCVEVIEVLTTYRVKLSIRDKNGLTPHQLATILYDNKRTTPTNDNKESKNGTVIVPHTKRIPSPLPPLSFDPHSRSSSFSYHRPSYHSMDGSTISLPVSESGSIQKKKPSATKSNRPVNLSFAQSYSRQVSGGSSRGSRSSEIYLKDKEQAERLSEVLDKQGSLDHLEKIVLDQTSYEPPIDMSFVPPVESFTLSHDTTRFQSKDHDVKIKLSESYWRFDPNETLDCKMAASLHWSGAYPSDYVFVSPIVFFSCRSKRACEVKLTLPHALHFPSEKHHKRITIYCTHTVNLQDTISSPSLKEFRRLATSDLTVDTHYVSFTTTVKYPSLFTVAVATPPPTLNNAPPILPMRCFLYIASPSEREQYVTNTDILMYVAMNLKTVEMAMKKYVLPDNFVLEEKGFVMTGPVLRVQGKSENDHWQITRRGNGIFRYNQVALSQEIESESYMTHQQSYPLKESLYIECNNASRVLKCRVSLECDGNELINMLITPYTPIKQVPTLDPFLLREALNSPYDMNSVSSSESIPLRTSSV